MRVMITSVGTATSIGLIKAFRLHVSDVFLIGVDINQLGFTAGSLLVDKYCKVGLAKNDSFFEELLSIIQNEEVDLLIPINDIEVDVVARNRDALPLTCKCIVPDYKTVGLCRDKLASARFALSIGVDCPEILDASSMESRVFREITSVGSKGTAVLEQGENLRSGMAEAVLREEAFIQRRAFGKEYTVDMLSDMKGNPLYAIPRERLETKAGVATKTIITKDTMLIEAAVRIARGLRLPGFSNVQFIKQEGASPEFIEVNPRFGGCSVASLMAAPKMFPTFLEMVNNQCASGAVLNCDVRWGSVITRYYEEVLYE